MNKLKIVSLATVFNLLFEFSMRGIDGIIQHLGLFLFLIIIYFSYFWIVESLIRVYRITNKQLLIISFTFGVLPMAFLSGTLFAQPLVLGINPIRLFSINIIWWWAIQGLLTFYLANRLVKREWDESVNLKGTWLAGFVIIIAHLIGFAASSVRGPGIGYVIVLLISIGGFIYLRRNLFRPEQEKYSFKRSKLLDTLAFVSVVLFLISGIFVATNQSVVEASVVDPQALRLVTFWTYIVFAGVVIYYLKTKDQITI